MRTAVIGGGPAGLYAAILIKSLRRDAEVRVLEQNPPEATYGFGVVFSDRALDFLKDDDPETHALLSPHMEAWPDLTLVHRDTAIAIDGNGFAAIGRLELLRLLRARAVRLGIEIEYDREATGPRDWEGADLVIAADGINSTVRGLNEAAFGPGIEMLSNRFAWYGTARPFDTLTLTFRENDDGFFVAHHYRYAPERSTFIVECDAATFARAGLAKMSDAASRAYCERIFAADLDGMPLLSNRSIWRRFPLVGNARWHAGNIVLIGDALRSAHFSIGSGTRLAMEDAIALAGALADEGFDVARGLAAFEERRRPVVDKLTAAARASAEWYERLAETMTLAPYDFAYSYMTRTGRVGAPRLRQIAPRFMADYERAKGVA